MKPVNKEAANHDDMYVFNGVGTKVIIAKQPILTRCDSFKAIDADREPSYRD